MGVCVGGAALKPSVSGSTCWACTHTPPPRPWKALHSQARRRDRDGRVSITTVTAGHHSSAATTATHRNSNITHDTTQGNRRGADVRGGDGELTLRRTHLAAKSGSWFRLVSVRSPEARLHRLKLWSDESMESRSRSGPPETDGPCVTRGFQRGQNQRSQRQNRRGINNYTITRLPV